MNTILSGFGLDADCAGIGSLSPDPLRHLCLTDLARGGWDIHEIAAFGRHRSLASALLYIHLSARTHGIGRRHQR